MKEFYIFTSVLVAVLHMAIGQGNIVFVPPTEAVAMTESPFVITCKLDVTDVDAVYRWFDNEQREVTSRDSGQHRYLRDSSPGLRLMFSSISDSDAGSYRCTATVNDQVAEANFQLVVRSSVKFVNCPTRQKGILGKKATITCGASAGGNPVRVEWERSGNQISFRDTGFSLNGTNLVIEKVTDEHAGEYMVVATVLSTGSVLLQGLEFEVIVVPKILESIAAETAIVGRKVALYCRASGRPLPKMFWFKEGSVNPLENNQRITVRENSDDTSVQGILEILTAEKDDEARYTCSAKNDAGTNSSSVFLTVQVPPSIVDMPKVLGTEGSGAELRCEARGDPVPDMMFTHLSTGKEYRSGNSLDDITVVEEPIQDTSNPGKILKLLFQSLNHANAGTWKCTASNIAAEVTKDVEVDVRFAPNFDNQPVGPFYNWAGNKEGYIPCTASANPKPVFFWYKGDKEITDADNFYNLLREDSDEDPFSVTSKLMVTYTGLNEGVFGEYRCLAKNEIGQNQQNLTMLKGATPPAPSLTINQQTATYVEVWLFEPNVDGPPVEFYKITYKKQGSDTEPSEKTVAKEYRDHIDASKRYTKVDINDLEASTTYVFTFFAINPVGTGAFVERIVTTPKKSVPGEVEILSEANSPYSTYIKLAWNQPDDGGATILSYRIQYGPVVVKAPEETPPNQGYVAEPNQNPKGQAVINNIKDTAYTVTGLTPGTFYQIQVLAINSEGGGPPGKKIIKTKDAPPMAGSSTGEESGLSTGAIIGIVVAVFLILLLVTDLTCYFKNNCGLLMSIKEKLGGGRGDEGYSAAKTDDVENLAKKDELTEEAKAAEEGEIAADDDKKEPLLSGEQKVDTVDEVDTTPEKKELEPEDKEVIKEDAQPAETQPAEEAKPEAPAEPETPAEPVEQPAPTEASDKPAE